jgi:hypothetical protein
MTTDPGLGPVESWMMALLVTPVELTLQPSPICGAGPMARPCGAVQAA